MAKSQKSSGRPSRLFSIDNDGQPVLPGWYDIVWGGDNVFYDKRLWWSGTQWLQAPCGEDTGFGFGDTADEYWRGLAEPPSETINRKPSSSAPALPEQRDEVTGAGKGEGDE